MKEIKLSAAEEEACAAVKRYVEGHRNRRRLIAELQMTDRTARRYIEGYKKEGRAYFAHGNRGKPSASRVPDDVREKLVGLYTGKYSGATYLHFVELAARYEQLAFSEAFVRKLMRARHILSPRTTKRTRRQVRHELRSLAASTAVEAQRRLLEAKILLASEAHPTRPRRKYVGELLQIDACEHVWFGSEYSHLHIAVDDANGNVVGYYFDREETLNGYYRMAQRVFDVYGIPVAFLGDRRTVFTYPKRGDDVSDRVTQFGYMCKCLGIQIRTTSVAQAKGRVERMFETLQGRLPLELRRAGVSTLEEANAFLPTFFAEFNARFGVAPLSAESAFVAAPPQKQLKLYLSVLAERTVGFGSSLRYGSKNFVAVDSQKQKVFFAKGTVGTVALTLDGELYFTVDSKTYALEEIPTHEPYSQNLDIEAHKEELTMTVARRTIEIPRYNNPWRLSNFNEYLSKIKHLGG